ncbi:MAG: proton-conducting transporter transmembrane domain-containing protein [Solirubrobacteraceae bacterium]
MSWALYAILGLPLAATLLSLLDGRRLAPVATLIAGLACFGLVIALAIEVEHGAVLEAADGWIRLDPLGAVFLLATGLLYAMAVVFSIGYLGVEHASHDFAGFAKRYFALMNLFGWSMLAVPLAADFGTLWVTVELTTIISALLVAIDRTEAALEASWKYVLIASSGLGIALLSIIILYATGTNALGAAYVPRFVRFLAHAHGLSQEAVRLAFVLAVVGFGTKVGFVPMHTWLPDAHSEAPAPASALLSGSLLADAFYAILRFFQVAVAGGQASFAEHTLIVFGVISLLAAAFFVIRQGNYKRLLAYSSIEHMGIVALGVGFGAPLAIAGALLHVITHASAKGLAFLGTGSLLRGYGTKEVDGVTDAGRRMRYTGPMFLAAALALCGLPVSGVFRSEFEIVSGAFAKAGDFVDTGVAMLLVLVNVAFFGVIWHAGRMVLSPSSDSEGIAGAPGASDVGSTSLASGDGFGGLGSLEGGGDAAAGATIAQDRSRGQEAGAVRERSAWMVAGMIGCLFVVIALGVHLPGDLSTLLGSAGRILSEPKP